MKVRVKKWLAGTVLTAGSVTVALVGAEVALRTLGPRETMFYVLPPDLVREFAPRTEFLPGISSTAHYSTNRLGLRGPEIPDDTSVFRVLVVGGSTSENVYLDDSRTWTQLVQDAISPLPDGRRAWVAAAGRSGMNARDHVVQVERLLAQLPRIDLLLILVGVNDLTVALSQGDAYAAPEPITEPAARRRQEARAFSVLPGALHEARAGSETTSFLRRSALWELVKRTRARLPASRRRAALQQDNRGAVVERWRENRRHADSLLESPPSLDKALAEYSRNLDAIVRAADRHQVPVSFLTQPTLWRPNLAGAAANSLWLGGIGDFQRESGGPYYSVSALATSMAAFNERLLQTCENHGLRCLDLAAHVPRDTQYFFDDAHFTELGSARVASAVADWMDGSMFAAH